jgi:hypothetical protein
MACLPSAAPPAIDAADIIHHVWEARRNGEPGAVSSQFS